MQPNQHDNLACEYTSRRLAFWDEAARSPKIHSMWEKAYHHRLEQIYRHLVPVGSRVLELGCGEGNLLASLKPSTGVGVDFSGETLTRAYKKHPELNFIQADVHDLQIDGEFDAIILSDLLNDVWDVQKVLQEASCLSSAHTRLILNFYSRIWSFPLTIARRIGAARDVLEQNWLTMEDMANLLKLAGFEPVRSWQEVLFPAPIPLLAPFFNRFLVKLPPFHLLALTNVVVARLAPNRSSTGGNFSVSVVIPARNEAGNVAELFRRIPQMGASTEIIFVEGGSKDRTYEAVQEEMVKHPEITVKLVRQTGVGKGDAVRRGFEEACGDILTILDADMTVAPEDLPRFVDALTSNKCEFVNGVRLVYPMQQQAMRFFNFLGNKFFSVAFSWVLGQSVKDTLCGTKMLWRKDYEVIARNRSYFGDFDPFGDFDLLFGAVKLNRKLVDMPVRYRERTYGTTNISRWKHGWLLLKMLAVAAIHLKFI